MSKGMFYKQLLVPLLVSGLWSCGGERIVPDRYLSDNLTNTSDKGNSNDKLGLGAQDTSLAAINESTHQTDTENRNKSIPLESLKSLCKHLVEEKELNDLEDRVSKLPDSDLENLVELVDIIPNGKPRERILKVLVSFSKEDSKYIINTLLYLDEKDSSGIREFLKQEGKIGPRRWLIFMWKHKSLSTETKTMLRRFRTEIKKRKDNDG